MHFICKKNFIQKNYNYARKGQFPKLKGAICNIPTDISDVTNDLPHSADSNGQIKKKVKLSRSRLFQPCFTRIYLFGSFLFKGEKSLL